MMRVIRALFSGDMIYKTPTQPLRGYDHVARDAPSALRWRLNTTGGTGHFAGTYNRQGPYLAQAAMVGVLRPVTGAGMNTGTNGMAGHLVRPGTMNAGQQEGL